MKHIVRFLAVAVFSLGIVACDNVILPPPPGGGGPPRDTTDPGDTTDREPRDTNFFDSLFVSGPIVDPNGEPMIAPENSHVTIFWDNGRGQMIAWGEARLVEDGKHWKAVIRGRLPEDLLYSPNAIPIGGGGVHGIAEIMLTNRPYRQFEPYDEVNMQGEIGRVIPHVVIYNTGREMYTQWSSPWIENFKPGYSMAVPAFVGYVPVDERKYPLTVLKR